MTYEFTLKYQLDDRDGHVDELVEQLGAGGCSDALIGMGQAKQLGFKFTRDAASALDALKSALEDIRRVMPGARLIEAGPDFVGLTDVADMVGMSRQNLRKLMLSHPSSFPLPVHGGSAGVWHLADLLIWLQQKEYPVDNRVVEVSQTARHINVIRELQSLPSGLQDDMRSLVA